jgi:hypothetical protein
MIAGSKIYSDSDYHLSNPLPPKVWHRAPIRKGIMWCKECHMIRNFDNPYKYLEFIGIKQKLVPAYHDKWVCEMCHKSEY